MTKRKDPARVQPNIPANVQSAGGSPQPMPQDFAHVGRIADDGGLAAARILQSIIRRDDGWLRVVPQPDEQLLYIKWKFVRGRYRGSYVMSRVRLWELDYGLHLLREKLDDVDRGLRRPTLDSKFTGWD